MPYNQQIETRIRKIISGWKHTDEKKMFGGVCHLLNGNMFCGVYKDFLILRLGKDRGDKALDLLPVKSFDITGKAMRGWVMVAEEGFRSDDELKSWLNQAKAFVNSLPPK